MRLDASADRGRYAPAFRLLHYERNSGCRLRCIEDFFAIWLAFAIAEETIRKASGNFTPRYVAPGTILQLRDVDTIFHSGSAFEASFEVGFERVESFQLAAKQEELLEL